MTGKSECLGQAWKMTGIENVRGKAADDKTNMVWEKRSF